VANLDKAYMITEMPEKVTDKQKKEKDPHFYVEVLEKKLTR